MPARLSQGRSTLTGLGRWSAKSVMPYRKSPVSPRPSLVKRGERRRRCPLEARAQRSPTVVTIRSSYAPASTSPAPLTQLSAVTQ